MHQFKGNLSDYELTNFHEHTITRLEVTAILPKSTFPILCAPRQGIEEGKVGVYGGRGARSFTSLDKLGEAAKAAWTEIPQETIRKAIDSFPPRLGAVAAQGGGPIDHCL